jgi:hypothetical protein
MTVNTRKRSNSATRVHPPLSELSSFNMEQLDALITECQNDMPEIDEQQAPAREHASSTIDRKESQEKAEQDAMNIKDDTGAAYLYGSLAPLFGQQIDQKAYRVYLDRLMRDAGNPSDPLERMIVEQLALCHHAIGRLHVKAAGSRSVQETTAYTAAAARLMAEHRRSTLALQTYRTPAPVTSPGALTLIRQQNVAVGEQQVALVENASDPPRLLTNGKQEGAPALEHHAHEAIENT